MKDVHSLTQTTIAHLIPGLLAYVVYVPAAGLITSRGLPPPLALFLTMLVVLIPCELGVLNHVRRAAAAGNERPIVVPYTQRLRAIQYAILVPLLLSWSFFCFFVIAPREERFLKESLSWLPGLIGSPVSPGGSRTAWVATMALGLLVNGLALPIVEELYFRGYLLPRIPCDRRWSPLMNSALFSLYHFFSPWQNLSRTLAVAPIAYAVSWRRSVYVGILTHCLLNTLAMSMALASLLK